ncbi:MAG: hypothetical protein WDO15_05605 [Bacteroidota bacterium]
MKSLNFFAVVLLLTPITTSAQSVDDIVQEYYKAVSDNGIDDWKKIKTAYIEQTTRFVYPGSQSGPDLLPKKDNLHITWREWPDKSVSKIYEDSVLNGTFYHVKGKHFYALPGVPRQEIGSSPYEPYFEFETVLVQHILAKAKSEFLGLTSIGTIRCYDIKATTKQLTYHFYFNPDNHLLEYWSNTRPDGTDGPMHHVFNYAKIEGFLIPMSETNEQEGKQFYWQSRKVVKLNVEIDPKMFDYDEKKK